MVKDHSDSKRGNPLPPHGLLFPIRGKGSSHRITHTTALCYRSCGALVGTRNSSMGSPGRIDPMTHRTMSECSYHGTTSHSPISNKGTIIHLLSPYSFNHKHTSTPTSLFQFTLFSAFLLFLSLNVSFFLYYIKVSLNHIFLTIINFIKYTVIVLCNRTANKISL